MPEKPRKTVPLLLLNTVAIAVQVMGCRTAPPCVAPVSPVSHFVSPAYDPARIRRVLVLPPENMHTHPTAAMVFFRNLVTELNSSGVFEAIVADLDSLPHCGQPYVSSAGQFPEQMLVELRQRYGVDGVLFSSLTDIHPYWPQRLGLVMHLVDTYDASTSISVSGHWNAEDGRTANQARAAFSRSSVASSIGDVELALHSPHYFSEFVACQLCERFVEIAQATSGIRSA